MQHQLDLDDVCASVGYTATRVIAAWFGGRELLVPGTYQADHPLRFLIGDSALQALVRDLAGERLQIPHATHDERYRRERVVAELIAKGVSNDAIAQLLDLSSRRVEQLRSELELRGWLVYVSAPRMRLRGRPANGALPTPALVTEA